MRPTRMPNRDRVSRAHSSHSGRRTLGVHINRRAYAFEARSVFIRGSDLSPGIPARSEYLYYAGQKCSQTQPTIVYGIVRNVFSFTLHYPIRTVCEPVQDHTTVGLLPIVLWILPIAALPCSPERPTERFELPKCRMHQGCIGSRTKLVYFLAEFANWSSFSHSVRFDGKVPIDG